MNTIDNWRFVGMLELFEYFSCFIDDKRNLRNEATLHV